MRPKLVEMWHDDFDSDDDDELDEWYDGYKKTQGPESRNKRRINAHCLASIRRWDWCMSEDEKKEPEK